MQQHLMQMQPMMSGYHSNNVTTDLIQKYLDENKQLILAILDNQNLGKLSECAQYQTKLQQNLMYLAAIADSQPPPPTMHAQFPPNAAMQPGAQSVHYLQHQQAQQMTPQSLMAARSPMLYAQQPMSALPPHHQQQSLHSQMGMISAGNNGLHILHGETNLGGNGSLMSGGAFPDFGRNTGSGSGEGMQATSRGASAAGKQDAAGREMANPGSSDGRSGSQGGQSGDGTEPLYLKGSEEEGN